MFSCLRSAARTGIRTMYWLMSVVIVSTGCSSRPHERLPTNAILLAIVDGSGWHRGKKHECRFRIANNSSQSMRLPGYFEQPPINDSFKPSFVKYEVETDNAWNKLDIGYDGLPEDYILESGDEWQMVIDISPFEMAEVSNTVRLRIIVGTIVSEPFTLDDVNSKSDQPVGFKN